MAGPERAEPTADDMALASRMLSVFDETNPDGSYLYTDDDVRHFLPLMLLSAGPLDGASLSKPLQELLGEAGKSAGVTAGMSGEQISAAMNAFYEKSPVNPALYAKVKAFLRGEAGAGGPLASAALANAIGQQLAKTPVGAAGRVAGTVAGGAMARFQVGKALDDKKK